MRGMYLMVCLTGILVILLSCAETDEKTVAQFGDTIITGRMIKDEYLAMSPEVRPELKTIDEKERFVRDVISKEILKLEARKRGLESLPQVIEVMQRTMGRESWRAFYEEMVASQVKVTDEEMRRLYDKQQYHYHLGWIFVRSKAIAEDLVRRISEGEDFGTLASIYSLDASRERGGDVGDRVMGMLPDNVEEIVVEMSPGDVSDVMTYAGYYMIVKLFGKEERERVDFESARTGLMSMLRMGKANEYQRELAEQLKQKYGVTFSQDAIDLIVSKTGKIYTAEDMPPGKIPEFSDEELDRVVAKYQGIEWRIRDYVKKLDGLTDFMRPAYGADREGVQALIGDFLTGEMWQLEITSEGYQERPDVVRAVERAVEEVIVTAMHDEIVKDVELEEDHLRQFYEENKAELITEPGANLAVIVLATEEEAKGVYDELQAGRKFEDLAREKSIDRATGDRGGELLRPLYQEQLVQLPDLEEMVTNLKVGAYSIPMAVPPGFGPDGYMIVKLLERIEATQLSFSEVRDALSHRVLQLEQDKVFGDWLKTKMEEYMPEIYPDALGPIDFMKLTEKEA